MSPPPVAAASRALAGVRVTTAALLFAHGVARLLSGGVAPFGDWLASQGIPAGLAVAWAVTGFELLAPPVWALGRFVRVLCAVHALILLVGVVMVHAPVGWFVVGLGRNGMEYSVLLIACLAAVASAAPAGAASKPRP
jgi:putative oxidoreductase